MEHAAGPVAQLEGFSCWYGDAQAPTLDDLSFSLFSGQLALLVGASGAGKTTLALALNGILQHVLDARVQGRVIVDGLDVSQHPVHAMATRVGIIFQDPDSQFVSLTVRDEIAFGPENLMLDRAEIERRRDAFVRTWQGSEPKTVATLLRDFERTVVYLSIRGRKCTSDSRLKVHHASRDGRAKLPAIGVRLIWSTAGGRGRPPAGLSQAATGARREYPPCRRSDG